MTKYTLSDLTMVRVTENDPALENAIPLIGIEQGIAHDTKLPNLPEHMPLIAQNFRNVIRQGNVEIWRLQSPVMGAGAVFLSPLSKDGQSGIQVDDVVVMPDHRGKGIGSALLQFTANLASERGLSFIAWECEEHNSAQKMYRTIGATPRENVKPFRLTKDIILSAIGKIDPQQQPDFAAVRFTVSNRFSLFRTVRHGIAGDYDVDPEQKSLGLQIEDLEFDTVDNAIQVLSHTLLKYRQEQAIDFVDIVIPTTSEKHLELIERFDAEQNSYSGNPAFLWELNGDAFTRAATSGKQIAVLRL